MTTVSVSPPVDPPPHLTSGGRSTVRVLLVLVASAVLLVSLTGLGVAAWGVSNLRVVTDRQALPDTMRTLVVDTASVPVAIRIDTARDAREATAELRLVNTSRSGAHRLVVDNDGAQSRISIVGEPSPSLKWARGGEITVSVPPEHARRLTVRTEQRFGAVIVTADLDRLVANVGDGAIVLRGSARQVQARTGSGEIVAHEPVSVTDRFEAATSSGNITVDFRDTAPRTLEALTRSGDVTLGLPGPGPFLVRAQSGVSAKVTVPETADPATAAGQVTARSDSGVVVVERVTSGR